MSKIILSYRRVEDTSSGCVTWLSGTPYKVRDARHFERLTFKDMLLLLREVLLKDQEAEVVFARNDRPGLLPYPLDRKTVELLVSDPVAAIRSFEYPVPHLHINIRASKDIHGIANEAIQRASAKELTTEKPKLISCRLRKGHVECPGCGMWSRIGVLPYECSKACGIRLTTAMITQPPEFAGADAPMDGIQFGTVLFDVEELLSTDGYRGTFYVKDPFIDVSGRVSAEQLRAANCLVTSKEQVTCQ